MRDILNDLEAGKQLSDPDPVRRAQIQMRAPTVKRFYKTVTVEPDAEGFSVRLDGKPRQDAGRQRRRAADRQGCRAGRRRIRRPGRQASIRSTMPVTRLVNTAIDGVATRPAGGARGHHAVLRRPISLCYRAEAPQALVDRQAEAWDPVIDWARSALGARFFLAEGVMHVEQPRETIGAVGIHLAPARRALPARRHACHHRHHRLGAAGAGSRGRRDRCRNRLEGGACRRGLEYRALGPRCRSRRPPRRPQARHAWPPPR